MNTYHDSRQRPCMIMKNKVHNETQNNPYNIQCMCGIKKQKTINNKITNSSLSMLTSRVPTDDALP